MKNSARELQRSGTGLDFITVMKLHKLRLSPSLPAVQLLASLPVSLAASARSLPAGFAAGVGEAEGCRSERQLWAPSQPRAASAGIPWAASLACGARQDCITARGDASAEPRCAARHPAPRRQRHRRQLGVPKVRACHSLCFAGKG